MKIFALILSVILISSSINSVFASEPRDPDPLYQWRLNQEATEVPLKHKGVSPEQFRNEFLAFADYLAEKQINNEKFTFDDILISRELAVSSANLKIYFTSRDNIGDQRSCVMAYGPEKCFVIYSEYLSSLHEENGLLIYTNSELYDQCRDRDQEKIKQCLVLKTNNQIDISESSTPYQIPSQIDHYPGWWASVEENCAEDNFVYDYSKGDARKACHAPTFGIRENIKLVENGLTVDGITYDFSPLAINLETKPAYKINAFLISNQWAIPNIKHAMELIVYDENGPDAINGLTMFFDKDVSSSSDRQSIGLGVKPYKLEFAEDAPIHPPLRNMNMEGVIIPPSTDNAVTVYLKSIELIKTEKVDCTSNKENMCLKMYIKYELYKSPENLFFSIALSNSKGFGELFLFYSASASNFAIHNTNLPIILVPVDQNQLFTSVTSVTSPISDQIPSWIKNNAGWWADGAIADSEFVSGLQFLISNGLITVTETTVSDSNDEIPSWIKQNAKWWSEGLITDSDFIKGIEYLANSGIIQVN